LRILITGGRGTVGSVLAKELVRREHSVTCTDLVHAENEIGFSLRTDVKTPSYCRCNVGDSRQIARVFESMGPFDLVYHMAAEFGRWNGEDFYEQVWLTNAVGTKNILRLQEKLRFQLVHFSSSEVYGDWEGTMSEDVMENHEIKQLNDYALSKWVNECQIRNSATQFGTESIIVRLFNTYGPGEYYSPYRSVNCRFVYCALMGLPWVVFRGYYRSSTYVDDTVRTLANITKRFRPNEVYNIGSNYYHSIEELSNIVIQATGADPGLAEMCDAEVLTTRIKKVDNSRAVRDLEHIDKIDLSEGIRRTVAWMRTVYKPPRADLSK
jgi:dTDP-glucose 4,6-dehydratase